MVRIGVWMVYLNREIYLHTDILFGVDWVGLQNLQAIHIYSSSKIIDKEVPI